VRLTIAFLAAILAPACLLAAWYLYGQFQAFDAADPYIWVRTRGFLSICLMISAAHVVVLGIPAYALLRWRKAIRWWSTIATGFILGAIPVAVVAWPLRYAELKSSSTVDGVQTMIDGMPTIAGWTQYFEGLSFFGACGALGAFAFWLTARTRFQRPTVVVE